MQRKFLALSALLALGATLLAGGTRGVACAISLPHRLCRAPFCDRQAHAQHSSDQFSRRVHATQTAVGYPELLCYNQVSNHSGVAW